MTAQLSLLATEPHGCSVVDVELGPPSPNGVRQIPPDQLTSGQILSDVRRRIEHYKGPFRWLVEVASAEGKPHHVLELNDGSFCVEMLEDRQRFPAPWLNKPLVEQKIAQRMWREVTR